eukprot:2697813-Rhodomonas_salina.1
MAICAVLRCCMVLPGVRADVLTHCTELLEVGAYAATVSCYATPASCYPATVSCYDTPVSRYPATVSCYAAAVSCQGASKSRYDAAVSFYYVLGSPVLPRAKGWVVPVLAPQYYKPGSSGLMLAYGGTRSI